jgi:hypothetical protein
MTETIKVLQVILWIPYQYTEYEPYNYTCVTVYSLENSRENCYQSR